MGLFERTKIKKLSDEEIIVQFQKKQDRNCIGELFNRYYHMVYGVGLKYFKKKSDAEDMTMLVFESLFDKLTKNDVRNFKSWLYRLTCNECLMKLREEKNMNRTAIEKLEFKIASNNDELEEKKLKESKLNQLEEVIESLKEEQKICIRLFYLDELTYNEVANRTNFSIKQVKSFIQNGKRNLKMKLE